MSGVSLREMEADEHAVKELASLAPTTWVDAVAAYLATRKEKLVSDIDRIHEHEVPRRSYQVAALKRLQKSLKPVGEAKTLRELHADATGDEKHIRLAQLLTPRGWRDKLIEPFQKLEAAAISALLERKEILQNQALVSEIRLFLRFLSRVEKDAQLAVVRRQKELKVVNARR